MVFRFYRITNSLDHKNEPILYFELKNAVLLFGSCCTCHVNHGLPFYRPLLVHKEVPTYYDYTNNTWPTRHGVCGNPICLILQWKTNLNILHFYRRDMPCYNAAFVWQIATFLTERKHKRIIRNQVAWIRIIFYPYGLLFHVLQFL